MGRVAKGIGCSVKGCEYPSSRSLSMSRVKASHLELVKEGRRVYLCKIHWRELKKLTREERRLERWRWG